MSENLYWKLTTSPTTEVQVAEDVVALRAPLVRVARNEDGVWSFFGPGETDGPTRATTLGGVVDAWPHVAGLSDLRTGTTAVWHWGQHGWAVGGGCTCGQCGEPQAADIDRQVWPDDVPPNRPVLVEKSVLSGQTPLTDLRGESGNTIVLGPGEQQRQADEMVAIAIVDVVRRWPHTLHALRALQEGRGMEWNAEALNWQEYELVPA
ncbi:MULTISPECIES: hypothetical protein [Actinoalloteichus]|uniref:Uncharacterized protein n=1 Tax=Actinoalloteichus fjordicus TaxID=1612552 RepID=A0AAC9L9Y8_9PSEU|nr:MULTISPECIES: hypothetical protein [Actinoalloteichus]APU13035.1 hypothetical protein UA74_04780 [Actinoalloteichus fjordicus]APU19008.1 hypothetical protein UA75_04895 [Actinoalloteichus sp. GBA129-24]